MGEKRVSSRKNLGAYLMVTEIRYSVNRAIVNKTEEYEKLSTGYVEAQGTLADVQVEVKRGFALCAGIVKGRRKKTNFVGSQWVLLDIDNSQKIGDQKFYLHQMTIEEALENQFIQNNCTFIYTTPSHTEDWHRFRLVFFMEEFISDLKEYESIVLELMKIIKCDPACKDGVRPFYGNTDAEFWTIGKTLNSGIVELGKFNASIVKNGNGKKEDHPRRVEYRKDERKFIEKLKNALTKVPLRIEGTNNYAECMSVLAGIHWLFAGEDRDELGLAIAREWCPESEEAGERWNIDQKWRSFGFDKENVYTIDTVFKTAKKYGWEEPKEEEIDHVKVIQDMRENGASESAINAYRITNRLNGEANNEHREQLIDDNYEYAQEEIKKTYLDDINLREFLNEDILNEYRIMFEGWDLKQSAILLMLLTGLSGLFPTPTKIHIKRGNYSVTPNMYCVHIAPSGAKKSAILKNLVSCGFDGVKFALQNQYRNKLAMWEAEDRKSRGAKPVEPVKVYTSPTSTKEGISDIIREYPDLSQVAVFEELNAFIAQDSYSKNKGDIRDFFKKAYDGNGVQQITRSNTISIENYQLSLATVVQPSVWFPYYNAEKDGDGLLCRFLVTEQNEMNETEIEETEEPDKLAFTTKLIYDTAIRLLQDKQEIRMLGDTRKVYAEYYYQVAQKIREESDDFLKQLLGKGQGHIAKIAINIHLLSEVMRALRSPGVQVFNPNVSPDAVRKAYKLWEYSYGCMRRVYFKAASDSAGMDLHSKILKLIDQGANSKREWTKRFCNKRTLTQPRDIDRALSYLLKEGVLEEVKEGRKIRYRRA